MAISVAEINIIIYTGIVLSSRSDKSKVLRLGILRPLATTIVHFLSAEALAVSAVAAVTGVAGELA